MSNITNTYSLACEYARRLGISPSIAGFGRFVRAVVAFASVQVVPKLNAVCAEIAGEGRPATIARSISYALDTTYDICDNLAEILGRKVIQSDIRPKNVISNVAECVKQDLAAAAA